MIKTNIEKLRDPFLIKDNDTYYVYGTCVKAGWDGSMWIGYKSNSLAGVWERIDSDKEYCVGIARSDNGKVDGCWIQDDELLYSKSLSGEEDGGHGMIFKDTDGSMYLVIHSPNSGVEKTLFIPICEKNGTLVCEF